MHSKLCIAREIAYDAFVQVIENKKSPEQQLEYYFSKQKTPIKRIDRNLAKEILYGGLRWYSKIYWIVQNTASRRLEETSPQIRSCLVLGAYQIFYLDRVPDRAAVNESVEYIKKKGQTSAVGFVNGILRSIARRSEYFPKPDKDKCPKEYLEVQYAYPKWLIERWSRLFKFERLREILASNNQQPPHTVRINFLKTPRENIQELRVLLLKEEKNKSEKKSLRSCLQLADSSSLEEGSLFQRGYFSVQDESSQLIAHLLNVTEGEFIIDACCAPGGKLGHIYELGRGNVELIGIDKSKEKLKKVQSNLTRLEYKGIVLLETDFLEFTPQKAPDKILLDAPCSGLGVIRRHPEAKWQKSPEIVLQMVPLQRKLLSHAFELLKPGGEMVFSVCSFEPEETLDQLEWALDLYKDRVEVVSPFDRLPPYYRRYITSEKALLVFSGNKDSMDGFGAFILRKKS